MAIERFIWTHHAEDRCSRRLLDRHPDDGHLMGFEIWEASKMLPAELIAALGGRDSDPSKPHSVAV